jgi:hypothetical protein
MLNLKVDSENKSFKIELMLKGELETLELEIREYKLIEEDDKAFIELKDITTNREWMNIMINTYMVDRRVEIPKMYVPLLEIAL